MIKFIKYFFLAWKEYPHLKAFMGRFTPEQIKEMEKMDEKRGIKPYKNRFDYALRSAKIHYAHRDRYGSKCKKYHGDCERCNAKHC